MPSLLDQIERVPIGSLTQYPGNARKGDLRAIAASLQDNGQVTPLVVQRSTRYILGGNNTQLAALSIGWAEIDVVFIDVDDDRARKINVTLNRTSDLATYDNALLLAQLDDLDDLDATGYGLDDLDELRRLTGAFGDEATRFLDDFTDPAGGQPSAPPLPGPWPAPSPGDDPAAGPTPPGAGPQPAPGPPPPPPDWVQLAWVVKPDDREMIRRAVALAQLRDNLDTGAEALKVIALHYLNTHS